VKIWFQNHRYKTKKALKDQSHAEHHRSSSETLAMKDQSHAQHHRSSSETTPPADRASLSPRKTSTTVPLLAKDPIKSSKADDDDDDWTKRSSTGDVRPRDRTELPPPGAAGFRALAADLRSGDAASQGYPSSMYGQPLSPPSTFLPTSAAVFHGCRAPAVAARPCSRSPVDATPPAFTGDMGLASVLYGSRDAVTPAAWVGPSMDYYYPSYAAAINNVSPSIDRTLSSPVGYLPVNTLRTW